MENNFELKNQLPLERTVKLQVFGISSIKKDVPKEAVHDKMGLAIVFAYTGAEAIHAAAHSLKQLNKNPDDYILNHMMVSAPLDQVVFQKQVTPDSPISAEVDVEAYMIGHIRQVFSLVGTKTENDTADKVITKFQEYAKERKNKTS